MIRAPFHAPQEKIRDFIHSRKEWIEKNRVEIQKKTVFSKPKNFLEGENFPFLGRHYKLKIDTNGNKIFSLTDDTFILHKNHLFKAKKIFLSWYKKRSLDIIMQRSAFYSRSMGLYPERIKITSARQRWGSCTHTNTLNFPWKIICLPLFIIDYVVIHELAHIKEKNHSEKFWHIVSTTMPDYKTRKKWLKEESGNFNCILTY